MSHFNHAGWGRVFILNYELGCERVWEAPAATERSRYCNQALLAPVTPLLPIGFSSLTYGSRRASEASGLNKITGAADFCTWASTVALVPIAAAFILVSRLWRREAVNSSVCHLLVQPFLSRTVKTAFIIVCVILVSTKFAISIFLLFSHELLISNKNNCSICSSSCSVWR